MTQIKVRHLVSRRNSDGSLRYYWSPSATLKAAGFAVVRLPASLPEAIAAAEEWNAKADDYYQGTPAPAAAKPGSIAALISLFLQSDEFKALKPRSRADHEYYLGKLEAYAGEQPFQLIGRKAAKEWLRKVKAKSGPAMAYHCYSSARRLFSYAADEEWRKDNPFAGLKIPAPKERDVVWTPEEYEAFRVAAVAAGRRSMALAATIAFNLAQREQDVLAMKWPAYDGSRIRFDQLKTAKPIDVRCLPDLKAWLDETLAALADENVRPLHILIDDKTGRPWNTNSFQHYFPEIRKAAGLRSELQFNDFRRSGATRLGDAGCTDDEIRAITGHKTRNVVSRYVRPTTTQADNAMDKVASLTAARAARKQSGDR
ncbi:tyrosine-type recombinase/integrase [Ferrovibrio sp.]|uniref:tyrosine-type recombinase/integrase n=1 Tax=Ferrovibrio sp. TaxID=1917215 RepID=UPI003D0A7743